MNKLIKVVASILLVMVVTLVGYSVLSNAKVNNVPVTKERNAPTVSWGGIILVVVLCALAKDKNVLKRKHR